MNDQFYLELQEDFFKEAISILDKFEAVLLSNSNLNRENVDELFRIAHTIKGSAAAVDLPHVAEFTHTFEDYLSSFRSNIKKLNQDDVTVLLEFSDHLKSYFIERLTGKTLDWNTDYLINKLNSLSTNNTESTAISDVKTSDAAPSTELEKRNKVEKSVKVDIERLEAIFDSIGEVVVFKNQIKSLLKNNESGLRSNATIDQLELLVKDLYDKALGLRMTSLQPIFQRMQRTLRDLSTKLNKDVEVLVSGEDTEIDRSLFEQISDPLIHLIRNAIDHGVEQANERLEKGKSAKAKIEIKSYYESGQVIIEIKDDGRGIDTNKVFEKAKANNLITNDSSITDFTVEEIQQFIFLPGFSTVETVSNLSGRGVGMDVVKTTIEKFHGKIYINSAFGKGTCFKLSLPLTTSLIDGISFKAGNNSYIIPNTSIISIDKLTPKDLNRSGENKFYVNCHEKPYMAVNMRTYFNQEDMSNWSCKIGVRSEIDGKLLCFLFDEVKDQCQVVVKPLPQSNQSQNFIGAAITDDGQAQLILDLSSIGKSFLKELQAS